MRRMDNQGQMTIEELASQAGTATTTVRMYQSRGMLPSPECRGGIGYYGQGHLARLRLIAQLQEQGFSLASIEQLTDAREGGRGLEDVLGLETQVAAVWAAEPPARLKLGEFKDLFAGQVTLGVIRRAIRMGLVGFDGISVTVNSPKLLAIGLELVRAGIPVTEMMDELEVLQDMTDTIAGRFTAVFERNMWQPFEAAGLPADQIRSLTESLQRLNVLAEEVVAAVLRDALRRKAGEFLAQQAQHLDSAGVSDEIRPLARAAGLDLLTRASRTTAKRRSSTWNPRKAGGFAHAVGARDPVSRAAALLATGWMAVFCANPTATWARSSHPGECDGKQHGQIHRASRPIWTLCRL
jgi:DNA-binding transcriptional MerR regulator